MALNFENIFKNDNTLLDSSESFWSTGGIDFKAGNSSDAYAVVTAGPSGNIKAVGNGVSFYKTVDLPQGSTVTDIIVYGSISDETYTLYRSELASNGAGDVMASGLINSKQVVTSFNPVDNSVYQYFIETSSLDDQDTIYGSIINFTIGQTQRGDLN